MLTELTQLVAPLKRWMRRRLEARHSGAKGISLPMRLNWERRWNASQALADMCHWRRTVAPTSELAGLSDEIKN